jgi:hypothetical protein
MDKQFIIHIVTEIVILSAISIYFHKRNQSLENSIKELRKELYNLQLSFIELQQTIKLLYQQPNRPIHQLNQIIPQHSAPHNSIINNKLVEQMIADNSIIPINLGAPSLHRQQNGGNGGGGVNGGGGGENPLLGGIMNMMPMFTSMMMGSFTSNKPKNNEDDKVVITDENEDENLIESTINDLTSEDNNIDSECKDGLCKVNLEELEKVEEKSE